MENRRDKYKSAMYNEYSKVLGKSSNRGGMMQDMMKYAGEMREEEKLKGGKADSMKLDDIAKKHNIPLIKIAKEYIKGYDVEMEHTKDQKKISEIVLDHLSEKPDYYQKLEKVETKEDKVSSKQQFAKDLQTDKDFQEFKKNAKYIKGGSEFTYGTPNVTHEDPYITKKTKYGRPGRGKEENFEATGSGSSGAYVGPVFGGDDEFWEKSRSETPSLKEGLATGAMGIDKVEAKEATGSGSVGGYSSPSMWAKSTKKKDWGPSRKTQIPGGGFVKVKKKCTRFPYCIQGDINALKITKNESVKEAVQKVSKKTRISERIIINILEHEYSKTRKRNK